MVSKCTCRANHVSRPVTGQIIHDDDSKTVYSSYGQLTVFNKKTGQSRKI